MLATVALLAGQRFATTRGGTDARANPSAEAPLATVGAPGTVRAPDISSLTPRERADRLFDRVMRLSSEGKTDSVRFFAPMAISVYQVLGPLDADLRYDFGRVAEAAGDAAIATAQADTILRTDPTHLLGLVLAARASELRGDTTATREFHRRLLAAETTEGTRSLPEYERHRSDILEALVAARRRN